ncbi:MAG: SH3 domain-containing protein [Nitrospinae bacterium]|nr:SH3 domain-containing protein [Nitrospinota bacterium]
MQTLWPSALSAGALYVKSSGTPVFENGSATARVIETLNEGVAVRVLKESGSFYKIALPKGGEGWVFKFKLTATPPAKASTQGTRVEPLNEKEEFSAKESDSGSSIRARDPNFKAPDDIKEVPKTERGLPADKKRDGGKK